MSRPRALILLAAFLGCSLPPCAAPASNPSPVRSLRVQCVGETTYFHAQLDAPSDLLAHAIRPGPFSEAERRRLALTPALVPQDGKAWAVYQRLGLEHFQPS